MKKLSIKKGVQCMACLECVRACSNAYYKEFHPDKAALKIVQRNDTVKPMVCVQCGKCAAACPSGAITQNPKGVWMISRKLCTGCGKCVEACPFGLIVKDENTPYSSKCTACGICPTLGCPAIGKDAASGIASIDPSLCIGCGQCAQYCARSAIVSTQPASKGACHA